MQPPGTPYMLQAACNSNCSCHVSGTFQPVCAANGVSFYSPCIAGCTSTVNGTYVNCSCVPAPSPLLAATANPGMCSTTCRTLPAVGVLLAIGMFMLFASAAPALAVVMRVLPPQHVSVGLGVMQSVWKLGSFPGPIVMGAIFDGTCLYSQHDCTTGGSVCILYDNNALGLYYAIFGILCKSGATAFYYLAYRVYQRRARRYQHQHIASLNRFAPHDLDVHAVGCSGIGAYAEVVHTSGPIAEGVVIVPSSDCVPPGSP